MYRCILKTAKDSSNEIQWQALYVDGKKVLENFEIDLTAALPIFSDTNECYHIDLYEENFKNIHDSFPDEEDFSYLLDYRDIKVGDIVWLEDGSHEVVEITEGYRNAGDYDYVEWRKGKPFKTKVNYLGHNVIKFKVKGKNITFVWEDYNYQQSELYNYIKNDTKRISEKA